MLLVARNGILSFTLGRDDTVNSQDMGLTRKKKHRWVWAKIERPGTAGFSLFHLPFHFLHVFLTHRQVSDGNSSGFDSSTSLESLGPSLSSGSRKRSFLAAGLRSSGGRFCWLPAAPVWAPLAFRRGVLGALGGWVPRFLWVGVAVFRCFGWVSWAFRCFSGWVSRVVRCFSGWVSEFHRGKS